MSEYDNDKRYIDSELKRLSRTIESLGEDLRNLKLDITAELTSIKTKLGIYVLIATTLSGYVIKKLF